MRLLYFKFNYILLFMINTVSALSQNVRIIRKGDFREFPQSTVFTFLEPIVNTGQIEFVATIEARSKEKSGTIEKLYNAIRKRAIAMGATCYKLNSFSRPDSLKETILVLDCYYAGETVMKFNASNQSLNSIFIIGNENPADRPMSFQVNGDPQEVKAGYYFKYVMKEGEEVKINKGGFTGSSVVVKWKPEQQPMFFTLSGFGLNSINPSASGAGASVMFNTGKIHRIMNVSVGLLITQMLKKMD
jgi:hypothetical protein